MDSVSFARTSCSRGQRLRLELLAACWQRRVAGMTFAGDDIRGLRTASCRGNGLRYAIRII